MMYQLWLFKKFGDKEPIAKIDSGNAPPVYEFDKQFYTRWGRPLYWEKIKSRIKVNYYLNIYINENTTKNPRP